MNAHTHRLQRGLTLTELLIASTIGILVIGGAIAVFSANQTVGRTTEQYQLAQDDFRYVSQIITRVVRDGVNFTGSNASTLVVHYSAGIPEDEDSGLRNCLGAPPAPGEINEFALTQQDGAWALLCKVGDQGPQVLMERLVGNGFTVELLRPSTESVSLGSLIEASSAEASSVQVTIQMRRPNSPNDLQARFVATMRCRVLGCPATSP